LEAAQLGCPFSSFHPDLGIAKITLSHTMCNQERVIISMKARPLPFTRATLNKVKLQVIGVTKAAHYYPPVLYEGSYSLCP
jgi:hypothetical protein